MVNDEIESELSRFDFSVTQDAPVFVIGVVSELLGMPVWTLRKLDQFEVVQPKRMGRSRCYSKRQIRTLRYVQYLMEEKNVTIGNVKVVLDMKSDWDE